MPWPLLSLSSMLDLVSSEIPSGTPEPASPAVLPLPDAARRALSVVGTGRYRLGRGGRKPAAPSPLDRDGLCDCSGFAAWTQGLDRYQPGRIEGDWISTTSIYRDALAACRLFRRVEVEQARAGDLVVYPSTYRAGVRTGIGHVGVIVARTGDGWAGLDVVDCAGRAAPAIAHRPGGGALWQAKGGIVVRRV